MRSFVLIAGLGLVAAQQNGVLVPPNNWLYTTGDATCRSSACAVKYPIDLDKCTCGGHQQVQRRIESCLPHCGQTCQQCEIHNPATKFESCPLSVCSPEEYAALRQDCVLTDWPTEWSECTKPCADDDGPGLQFKRREILQQANTRGTQCPAAALLYQERTCNTETCTTPTACHENPYCAATLRECSNVRCDIKLHSDAGAVDADHFWEEGCTIETDDPQVRKKETGETCTPKAAVGKFHVRVHHKGWTNFSEKREADGAQHFCNVNHPFNLGTPSCKCLCANQKAVTKQCNMDGTHCEYVASKQLMASAPSGTTVPAPTAPPKALKNDGKWAKWGEDGSMEDNLKFHAANAAT